MLNAQVSIKEKVEIEPKSKTKILSSTSSQSTPSITVSFFWRSPNSATVSVSGPCGVYQSVTGAGNKQNGATIQFDISPAPSGAYSLYIDLSRDDLCGECYYIWDETGYLNKYDNTGPGSCWIDHGPIAFGYEYASGFVMYVQHDTIESYYVNRFYNNMSWPYLLDNCVPKKWTSDTVATMNISKGSEFGEFYYFDVKNSDIIPLGKTVTGPPDYISKLWFIANDYIPPPGGDVVIELTNNGYTTSDTFFVKPDVPWFAGFDVTLHRDTLKQGESTKFEVRAHDQWGNEFPIDSASLLSLVFFSGEGAFVDEDGFIITQATYQKLRDGKVQYFANGASPISESEMDVWFGVLPPEQYDPFWDGKGDWYVKKSAEILLGETKYYYVQIENEEPVIKETTDCNSNPGEAGVNWGTNSITVVEDQTNSGKKLGVYWDKKKPDGTPLPAGMIRLVGRYWDADSIYKVMLMTKFDDQRATKYVEVKKPSKLGEIYTTSTDVYGNSFNVDDLVVEYAGKSGIPPQYIKGQMYQESSPKFSPSYRYEPGVDYDIQKDKDKMRQYLRSGYPFVVTLNPNSMGGTLPTNHQNVTPHDYQRTPVSISQYMGKNISDYIQRDKNDNNQITFLGGRVGDKVTQKWKNYYLMKRILYLFVTTQRDLV